MVDTVDGLLKIDKTQEGVLLLAFVDFTYVMKSKNVIQTQPFRVKSDLFVAEFVVCC